MEAYFTWGEQLRVGSAVLFSDQQQKYETAKMRPVS